MRVVTFNLHFATRVDRALEVIRSEPDLAAPDLISLQEADASAVAQIADALGMESAWYPAAIHPRTGRHFAPAVLSRRPITTHRLVELPHDGLHGLRRVAVHTTIGTSPGADLHFVAVHFGTMREILPWQQAAQVRVLLDGLADHTGPLVIAGDLNRKGLGRVFTESGFHWVTRDVGRTHHVWSFDHVFVRGVPAAGARFGSVRSALRASDHRAVWADLDHRGGDPRE